MRRALALAMFALSACATALPQIVERPGDLFDVRYDPQVQGVGELDAKANEHCGAPAAFVRQETRFDGFAYRTYRCARR